MRLLITLSLALMPLFTACESEPAWVEQTIAVEGMTCEACEHAIKRAVGELEGVESCTASHKDKAAQVRFDSNKVDPAAIAAVIQKLGYKTPAN